MKDDPFYVKDSLSSQFDNEDKIRRQKRLDFMEQQKKDYLEYLQMKDNKRIGTPFKITEDANYHPPIKNLDSQDANLCTNIAKDNQYSRAGYKVNQWKIPDKYEKNFDEKYIRGKNKNTYNIINHQIYDNIEEKNNKRINPSLREEFNQYEKNINNQMQMQNQLPLNNDNNNMDRMDRINPSYEPIRPQNDNLKKNNYQYEPNYPPLNERFTDNDLNEKNYQEFEKNQINNNQMNLNSNMPPLPRDINQGNEPKINDVEYKNYLEYIKQKELLEKEKEYQEYIKQKELMAREEQERQRYDYNLNNQNLPNFHNFINTAEDYQNKQRSYIDLYAENLEKQKMEQEYKRQQEQKVLTKENMELYAQQQENNRSKNNMAHLPFDRFQEEKEEYLSNKKKNISTYSNLTSMTTTNPSLKNDPNVMPYIDPEKAYEMKLKEERMKKYRRELDEQIRNRPQEAYGRINNDKRIEVPPDPCKS
jgi:hypothetical protein